MVGDVVDAGVMNAVANAVKSERVRWAKLAFEKAVRERYEESRCSGTPESECYEAAHKAAAEMAEEIAAAIMKG